MENRSDIFGKLGLGGVPWRIRVYLILVASFILLVITASIAEGSTSLQAAAQDGLKMVLGALLGALALFEEARRSGRRSKPRLQKDGTPDVADDHDQKD